MSKQCPFKFENQLAFVRDPESLFIRHDESNIIRDIQLKLQKRNVFSTLEILPSELISKRLAKRSTTKSTD